MTPNVSIGPKAKKSLSRNSGFTLIELAIVVVIVGILISVVASTIPSLLQSAKIKKGRALLERADFSLQGYISANGRCPCPDTDGDGNENRTVGATPPVDDTCIAYSGDLPYLTLGLSSAKDPWQNPIRYSVYENLIQTSNSTICANSPCTTCLSDFISSPNATFLRTTDASGSANQAYLLASGGTRDMDGVNGFFDGINGQAPAVEFETANKIMGPSYDDLVLATALTTLKGRICSGGSSTTPSPTAGGEASVIGGCTNALDDDGDGFTDCADQDCFTDSNCSSSPGSVSITTASIPAGTLNGSYSAMFQAAGGQIPYEWTLSGSGGFSSLFLHTYTGQLSGTLDQCPGSYTVEITAEDTTPVGSGGPITDSKSFSLTVTSDLAIARTSGTGTNIDWLTADQEETFQTTGGNIGTITWQLNSGGADGFIVESTGDTTCTIKKDGATTTGVGPYTFTLTATDSSCSSNNTTQLTMTVTIPSSGSGADPPGGAGAVAQWMLDECSYNGTSGEVTDSSGNAFNGRSRSGANTHPSGKICRGAEFDGSNDYLDMGDILNDVLGTSSTEFTITAFIYPTQLRTSRTNHQTRNCFFAKASDSNTDNIEIGVETNGRLHLYLNTVSQNEYATIGNTGDISTDQWNFIAISYNSGTMTTFINNQKYTDTSTWSGGGAIQSGTGSQVTIGSSQNVNNYFTGMIDEVQVFGTALSDTAITTIRESTRTSCTGNCYTGPIAHYRMDETSWSGTGSAADVLDSSGNGYHGTSYHGLNTTSQGKLCYGGTFTDSGSNTNNDRVKLPHTVADGLTDFSISLFLKTAKTDLQGLVTGARWFENNELALWLLNSTTFSSHIRGGRDDIAIPSSIADNQWHHVVWMRSDNRTIIYMDGALLGSASCSTTAISIDNNGLWLGSDQDTVAGTWESYQEFVGTMDEVVFYDRVLSESEINALKDPSRTCP